MLHLALSFLTVALASTALAESAPTVATSSIGHPLAPQVEENESYGETYSLVVDLSNGAFLQMQLFVSNLGPGSRNAGCRFLYVVPDADPWTLSLRVSEKEWRFEQEPGDRLTVGPCSVGGSGPTSFSIPFEEGTVVAKLDRPIQPTTPPGHHVKLEDGFYELEVLTPWAEATVTIQREGEAAESLTGHAYLDHSRATAVSKSIAKQWIRFRALDPKNPQLVLVRFPADSSPSKSPDGWLWRDVASGPSALSGVKVGHRGEDTKDEVRSWLVLAKSRDQTVEIRSSKLLYRHAPAEEYGMIGRIVGTFLGNPITYTYRADLLRSRNGPSVPGLLEVTLIDG
jgi:hypothetical protein